MRKLLLLAGAACMAAVSMPAAAGPGNGNGKGRAHAAKAERGDKRVNRAERRAVRAERRADRRAERRAPQRRVAERRAAQRQVAQRRATQRQAAERRTRLRENAAERRQAGRERVRDRRERLADVRQDRREQLARLQRIERQQRLRDRRDWQRWQRAAFDDDRRRGWRGDCPPGLARKNNGCLPPGHARRLFARGDRVERSWFDGYDMPVRYRSFYRDTPNYYYRYDDGGYIYRIGRQENLISSVIPLFGGGFAVGQPLPVGYDVYNVPYAYRDIYYDTPDHYYRYGDDAIYRVDAQSNMIESIVSLLAGDLAVGQRLPAGYDVYNVPLAYRDRYYDTDDYMYRYADNAIYQVDPETMLVQAIVEMLV